MDISNGLTLPKIDRASSENSIYFGNSIRKPDGSPKSVFEQRVERLSSLAFPTVDSEASVKGRLSTLEATVAVQSEHNRQGENSLLNLSRNLEEVDINIKTLILNMQADFDARLTALKKEYDHRFAISTTLSFCI